MTEKNIDITYIFCIYRKFGIENGLICFLNQKTNLNREVIIVDDFSQDNAAELVKNLFDGRNINYKIVRNEKNYGPSISFNIGTNHASGKYLAFADADDFFPENVEQKVVDILEKEQADFMFGKTYKTTNAMINEDMNAISNLDNMQYLTIENNILNYILTKTRIAATYLVVKKDLFFQSGGFDEQCFIQDVPIFLRLALYSKKLIHCQNYLFYFKKSEGTLSSRAKQVNKDGFYSYYNFLTENENKISPENAKILRKNLISMLYKSFKRQKRTDGNYCTILLYYIANKLNFIANTNKILALKNQMPKDLFE